MRGMIDFSGVMDWAFAWRSICQKGNIRPVEEEFCPAQSSSSKRPLVRTKSGVWAEESKPQHVIYVNHVGCLVTSVLCCRLGKDSAVWWSAWKVSCHHWWADYTRLMYFLCSPPVKVKVNKTAAGEYCRSKPWRAVQYDLAVATIRLAKWAKLACD